MQQDKKPLGLRKRKKSNLTPAQSAKLDSMIKNFSKIKASSKPDAKSAIKEAVSRFLN